MRREILKYKHDNELLLLMIKNLELNMKNILIDQFFLNELCFFVKYLEQCGTKLEQMFETPSDYRKHKKELGELKKKKTQLKLIYESYSSYNISFKPKELQKYKNFIRFIKYQLKCLQFNKAQVLRIYEKYEYNLNSFIFDDLRWIRKKIKDYKTLLIEENRFLVVKYAENYKTVYNKLTITDLIQEGMIGLIKSINMFDVCEGTKLSTYSTSWIRHFIGRAIQNQSRIIRLPIHAIEYINKIKKFEEEFIAENNRKPELKDIAKKLKLDKNTIKMLFKFKTDAVSIDSSNNLNKTYKNINDINISMIEINNIIEKSFSEEEKEFYYCYHNNIEYKKKSDIKRLRASVIKKIRKMIFE